MVGGTNKRKRMAKQCRGNVEIKVRNNINILAKTEAKSASRRIKDSGGNSFQMLTYIFRTRKKENR